MKYAVFFCELLTIRCTASGKYSRFLEKQKLVKPLKRHWGGKRIVKWGHQLSAQNCVLIEGRVGAVRIVQRGRLNRHYTSSSPVGQSLRSSSVLHFPGCSLHKWAPEIASLHMYPTLRHVYCFLSRAVEADYTIQTERIVCMRARAHISAFATGLPNASANLRMMVVLVECV